jgi:hypothetical protein
MKLTSITIALLSLIALSAEIVSTPELDIFVPVDQEVEISESDDQNIENGPSATRHAKVGNIDVSVTLENVNSNSQWEEEWSKNRCSDDSNRKDNNPSARVSVQWSSDD